MALSDNFPLSEIRICYVHSDHRINHNIDYPTSGGNATFLSMSNTPGASSNQTSGTRSSVGQSTASGTAEPTTNVVTPTTIVIRPTVISFPSVTPILDPTEKNGETTSEVPAASVICKITTMYNLNLREKPATDSIVYLSIPSSVAVAADGRTTSNWYHVTYNGQVGWVSCEFITTDGPCKYLAVVKVP